MTLRTVLLLGVCMLALNPLRPQSKTISSPPVPRTEVLRFADTARYLEKKAELGITYGYLHYLGDLSNDKVLKMRPGQFMAGVLLRRHIGPNLALRGNLSYGQMSETDESSDLRRPRNTRFEADVAEMVFAAEWHIFGKKRFRTIDTAFYDLDKYRQAALVNKFKHAFSPYLFGGGGGIMTRPRASFDLAASEGGSTMPKIKSDKQFGSGTRIRPGIAFGGGVRIGMGRKWGLGLEAGARTAFTDYFDGVSQSANPSKNDWYWVFNMALTRRLGTGDYDGDGVPDNIDRCPKIPGKGSTKGCPDADGDGVADREDECPHKYGPLSMGGCPLKGVDYDSIADVEFRMAAGLIPPEKMDIVHFSDSARTEEHRWDIGFLGGGVQYLGDLSNDLPLGLREPLPMGGLFVRRQLGPMFAVRANALMGKMAENDLYNKSRAVRNFSFETPFQEFSLQLEWDIWGKQRVRHTDTVRYRLSQYEQRAVVNAFRRSLSPYLFAGGGAILTNVKTTYDMVFAEQAGLLDKVLADQAAGTGRQTNWGALAGVGVRYDLNRNWVLGGELGARTAFNDYFDGVKLSGTPNRSDWYWFGAVTLSRRLGRPDRDGDGIADRDDPCPNTPGRGKTKGCPDADNDGIADRDDLCPHRPGVPAKMGCPLPDMDKDSVPDADDLCPEVYGLAKFKGCPDTDGDGVEDRQDSCHTVAGLVEFQGCPDTDGDGITDAQDACPNEKGEAEYYKGCPAKDTDGDGVEDKLDPCPLVQGPVSLGGCPDTDGDGVEDSKDPCPTIAGKSELGGCLDTDGDNVPDNIDECPTIAGAPEWKGCKDTDGDGISDKYDLCPDLPGKAEDRGCPPITKKEAEKLEFAVEAVKFETGKATLKSQSNKILTDIADILKKYQGYQLRIEGHTDNVGSDKTNQTLSEKRATACLNFLAKKGVPKDRMSAQGFGETKPVEDNNTEAGRTKNRRVEFHLYLPQ